MFKGLATVPGSSPSYFSFIFNTLQTTAPKNQDFAH